MTAIHDDSPTRSRAGLRVTVNLTTRSVEALEEITKLTGDTKTDAINKALQVYAQIQEAQRYGGGAWLQEKSGADPILTKYF